MECTSIHFSRHALQRMFSRALPIDAVMNIVRTGEAIEDYPDDFPYPSSLLLGMIGTTPVHAVAARDPVSEACIVVTVYIPDAARWSADFKSRKS